MAKRRFRDALNSSEAAGEIAATKAAEQETERQRIRAKLSETDRGFMDEVKRIFPSARLVGIHFSDGEKKGNI